jgi:hypothetical protein
MTIEERSKISQCSLNSHKEPTGEQFIADTREDKTKPSKLNLQSKIIHPQFFAVPFFVQTADCGFHKTGIFGISFLKGLVLAHFVYEQCFQRFPIFGSFD